MRITKYMTAAAAMMLFVAGQAARAPDGRLDIRSGGRQSGCAEHGRPKGKPGQPGERRTG